MPLFFSFIGKIALTLGRSQFFCLQEFTSAVQKETHRKLPKSPRSNTAGSSKDMKEEVVSAEAHLVAAWAKIITFIRSSTNGKRNADALTQLFRAPGNFDNLPLEASL
jgi:hypothetical protein